MATFKRFFTPSVTKAKSTTFIYSQLIRTHRIGYM